MFNLIYLFPLSLSILHVFLYISFPSVQTKLVFEESSACNRSSTCETQALEEIEESAAAAVELYQLSKRRHVKSVSANDSASLRESLDLAHLYKDIPAAMAAAFRLNLFDEIPLDVGATFDEIVLRTKTSRKGMDTLLRAMIAVGALTYRSDTARFYNQLSDKDYLEEFKMNFLMENVAEQRQLKYLDESIREGQAVGLTKVLGDYQSLYEARSNLTEVAKDWDPWMESLNRGNVSKFLGQIYELPAVVARIGLGSTRFNGTVLDWCGNEGYNSIDLAREDPTMKLTVLDLPSQVAKAAERIRTAGLQDQIDTLGVDLFDDNLTFEHKYDAVIMIHMIREWAWSDVAYFFKIIHSILKPGGIVLIKGAMAPWSVGKDYDYYQNLSREEQLARTGFDIYFLNSASHDEVPKTDEEIMKLLSDTGFVDTISKFDWVAATRI